MSHKLLIREARRRQKIFKNLDKYFEIIKSTIKKLDPNAEIYLFGSVATGKHLYSSDIDILVLTNLHPTYIISELWRKGIGDPFEIHVRPHKFLSLYKAKGSLIKIL